MSTWPDGYGRVVLDTVESTLDEARRQVGTQTVPFWCLAHHQTAPRGRRGRAWSMQRGNFAATLMLKPAGGPTQFALRSFVMSLALYRSFVDLTGETDAFALKWPNDVLLRGGKVAGILLESSGPAGHLAIGVGVNLEHAPSPEEVEDGAFEPVALGAATGRQVDPEEFLSVLAAHYATLEHQFTTYGFDPIRTGWLAHAARLGERITARATQHQIAGTFEDVDAEGHLVIRGPRGVEKIAAADVYF